MLRRFFMLLCVTTVTVFTSCSIQEDDSNFVFTTLRITDVVVPESFNLNETYEISVTYIRPNGCTYFERFDVQDEAITTRNVAVIGYSRTDLDACTQAIVPETNTFNFKVIYTDTYTFKFYIGEDSEGQPEFIELQVPVNEN